MRICQPRVLCCSFTTLFLQHYLCPPEVSVSSYIHELAGDYESRLTSNLVDEREPDFCTNLLLLVSIKILTAYCTLRSMCNWYVCLECWYYVVIAES